MCQSSPSNLLPVPIKHAFHLPMHLQSAEDPDMLTLVPLGAAGQGTEVEGAGRQVPWFGAVKGFCLVSWVPHSVRPHWLPSGMDAAGWPWHCCHALHAGRLLLQVPASGFMWTPL